MTTEEIKELVITSSTTYLNYLDANQLGFVTIRIHEKESVNPETKTFKLSALTTRIYEIDAISFVINNIKYDTNQIKIIEYDADQNFLIVQIAQNVDLDLQKIDTGNILIVSDLKFLVQRVIDWYTRKGDSISLPIAVPTAPIPTEYFQDKLPNPQQQNAIEKILTSSLSYVWGAPGTGKTTMVLAYPVIQYVRQGKKIAILAPTNNALEQALGGIIEMTDKAGIDRKQIIRLGNPSKNFAERFPEVCEAKGILKKIKEIDAQIDLIKKTLKLEEASEQLINLKKGLSEFQKITEFETELAKYRVQLTIIKRDIDTYNSSFKVAKSRFDCISDEIQKIKRVRSSFFYKVKNIFHDKSIKTKEELRLDELYSEQKEKEESLAAINIKLKILEEQSNLLNSKCNDVYKLNLVFKKIHDFVNSHQESAKIIADINLVNYDIKKDELTKAISSFQNEVAINQSIGNTYTNYTHLQKIQLIGNLSDRKINLLAQTTEERLKDVNIIASTLDCYIGRFIEQELNVSHFFLDEAGYACTVKALTLFRNNVPITFLGDHMQLPPVCQLNERDFAQVQYRDAFIWAQSALYSESFFSKTKNELYIDYSNHLLPTFNLTSKVNLITTHRFGSNLSQVLDTHVYQNQFNSANQNGITKIFYAHVSNDIPPANSRENYREAEMIRTIVASGRVNLNSTIILSPYVNQMNLIGSLLPELRRNLQILTVHRSQGREWDTVILSVSDTDNMFLVNAQRLQSLCLINTAVSRAKKELIIVCNHNYWSNQHNQLITGLIGIGNPYPLN